MSRPLPTPERLRELFTYDPSTGELRWRVRRQWVAAGRLAGRISNEGYRLVHVEGRMLRAHRIVWAMTYGAWPKRRIDHANNTPGDNRITNLREATHGENMANRRRNRTTASGYKGVYWSARAAKWMAIITKDHVRHYLGVFDTPFAAHAAYAAKAQELHGAFARPS